MKTRITEMEERLDKCRSAADSLSAELDRADDLRDTMIILFSYYGSDEWYEDRESDDQPAKAGVLSEDAVYDLITNLRECAFRMIETATDILKNRI